MSSPFSASSFHSEDWPVSSSGAKRRRSDEGKECYSSHRAKRVLKPKQTRRIKSQGTGAGRKPEVLSYDDGFSLRVCQHLRQGCRLPLTTVAHLYDQRCGESYALVLHRSPLQASSNTHLHIERYLETQVMYLIGWGGNAVKGEHFPIVLVEKARQLAKKKADAKSGNTKELVKPSPQQYEDIFERLPPIDHGQLDLLGSRVFGPSTSSFSASSSKVDDYVGNYCRVKKVVPDTCLSFRVWAYRLLANSSPLEAHLPSPSQILRINIITRWWRVPSLKDESTQAFPSSSPDLSDSDSSSSSCCSSGVSSPFSMSPVQGQLDQSPMFLSDASTGDTYNALYSSRAASPSHSCSSLEEHAHNNSELHSYKLSQPRDYCFPVNSPSPLSQMELGLDSNSETDCPLESILSSSSCFSAFRFDLDAVNSSETQDFNHTDSTGFAGLDMKSTQASSQVGFLPQIPHDYFGWDGLASEPHFHALVDSGNATSALDASDTEHSVRATSFSSPGEAKITLYFGVTPCSKTAFTRQFNRILRKIKNQTIDKTFQQGYDGADAFLAAEGGIVQT